MCLSKAKHQDLTRRRAGVREWDAEGCAISRSLFRGGGERESGGSSWDNSQQCKHAACPGRFAWPCGVVSCGMLRVSTFLPSGESATMKTAFPSLRL